MKLSWLFVILLMVFVAVFSVQNADVITVNFLVWHLAVSAALVIQLAALLGALVGLSIGYLSGRRRRAALSAAPLPERPVEPVPVAPRDPPL